MVLHIVVVMGLLKFYIKHNSLWIWTRFRFQQEIIWKKIGLKTLLLKWLILWGLEVVMDIAIFAMFLVCMLFMVQTLNGVEEVL